MQEFEKWWKKISNSKAQLAGSDYEKAKLIWRTALVCTLNHSPYSNKTTDFIKLEISDEKDGKRKNVAF